ncbi:MAG: hypothetical protein AB2687_08075 [Candidatus Thiodiazotropha taylori]
MKAEAEKLLDRLNDQEQWPGIHSVEYFNKLQSIAKESLGRKTTDGYLASVLIVHQIAEELIKILIDDAEFYIQLKLYPYPFKKQVQKNRMFGQIIRDLESTVWFQNKVYIIENAKALNRIRIKVVHGLADSGALDPLQSDAEEAWALYSNLQCMWYGAHMIFHSEFADLLRDESWPPSDVVFMKDDGEIQT